MPTYDSKDFNAERQLEEAVIAERDRCARRVGELLGSDNMAEKLSAIVEEIIQKERERCAKIADLLFKGMLPDFNRSPAAFIYYKDVAAEIRKDE